MDILKKNKVRTEHLPLQIVELENDNYHILVEGRFHDDTPSYWVIDTGASKTVLDINLTNYYKTIESDNPEDYQSVGVNREMMETSVGEMSCLYFGEVEISKHKVALLDLAHVNDVYKKYTSHQIAGLLGGDILMRFKCTIDYAKQSLKFQF